MFEFDKGYVQLCAEMAYNESLIQYAITEESSNGNSFKERITKIIENVKNFLKNIKNKVINFIREKYLALKEKIKEIKNKKSNKDKEEKNDTKQEAFIESLMSLVLNEEESEGAVNWNYVYEIMIPSLKKSADDLYKTLDSSYHKEINKANDVLRAKSKEDIDNILNKYLKFIKDGVYFEIKIPGYESSYEYSGDVHKHGGNLDETYKLVVENSKKVKSNKDSILPVDAEIINQILRKAQDIFDPISVENAIKWVNDDDELKKEKIEATTTICKAHAKYLSTANNLMARIAAIVFQISVHAC